MEKASSTGHAVLVSSPGMGHLTPLMGLAKRLSSLHSFKVTILFVSSGHAPLTGGGDAVSLVKIPAADISNKVEPGAHLVVKICALMRETMPSIKAAVLGLRPSVIVLDLFATESLPIARELALPCFIFVTSAWCLAYHAYSPVLDGQYDGDHQFFDIPGCKPLRRDDVVEAMTYRGQPQYIEFMRIGAEIALFDGVLAMTWEDLEGSTLAALKEGTILSAPVYDIGPILVEQEPSTTGIDQKSGDPSKSPLVESSNDEMMLMAWLDQQPAQSVIYVSFGSGGALSKAQMAEVALGLELSQQRFVWVVRPPMDDDSSATYLGLNAEVDKMDTYLPHGFGERTCGVGQLVPQWAPQSKVLSHPSVGGFLTHCGWNSIMESLSKGVPMMVWPMFAEQRMNAAFLVEELKVAVRATELAGENVVGREEIGKTVRVLLKDNHLRLRAKEIERSSAQALTMSGSSFNRLSQFVQTLKN